MLRVCSSTYRAYNVEFASSIDSRVMIVRNIDSPGLTIGGAGCGATVGTEANTLEAVLTV